MRPRQNHPHPVRCVLLADITTQDDRVTAQVCEPTTNTVDLIQYQDPPVATWQINGGAALSPSATDAQVRTELESQGNAADSFRVGYAEGGAGIWTVEWLGTPGSVGVTSTDEVTVERLTNRNAFFISKPGNNRRGQIMVHPIRNREGKSTMYAASICLATWLPGNGYGVQVECRDLDTGGV